MLFAGRYLFWFCALGERVRRSRSHARVVSIRQLPVAKLASVAIYLTSFCGAFGSAAVLSGPLTAELSGADRRRLSGAFVVRRQHDSASLPLGRFCPRRVLSASRRLAALGPPPHRGIGPGADREPCGRDAGREMSPSSMLLQRFALVFSKSPIWSIAWRNAAPEHPRGSAGASRNASTGR